MGYAFGFRDDDDDDEQMAVDGRVFAIDCEMVSQYELFKTIPLS